LEEQEDRLDRFWSPVSHLHSVADNEALRDADNRCLPMLTDYRTEVGRNVKLFEAFRAVAGGPGVASLTPAQKKVVENALRDFRLSGVELPPEQRERFRELQQELSRLQTKFEENLLDATQAWSLHVTDGTMLKGLPESALALAAQAARHRELEGWLFTLEMPSYLPVLQYAEDAGMRRRMYEAYVTRASDRGPHAGRWDNTPVLVKILAVRQELAAMLGYESYAHMALVPRMASSPDEVLGFLRELGERAVPVARREFEELKDFALERFGVSTLDAWDIAFYSEKLRLERFEFSEEELRPYFPAPRVLEGLFTIASRLYGVRI